MRGDDLFKTTPDNADIVFSKEAGVFGGRQEVHTRHGPLIEAGEPKIQVTYITPWVLGPN
jgi:hypothetical protein